MYWIHIWPGFAMLMQVVVSRFVFIYSLFEYMIKFGVFYMLINCFGAWERGKPLYPFMPWGDQWKETIVIGVFLFAVAIVVFKLNCYLVIKFKSSTP